MEVSAEASVESSAEVSVEASEETSAEISAEASEEASAEAMKTAVDATSGMHPKLSSKYECRLSAAKLKIMLFESFDFLVTRSQSILLRVRKPLWKLCASVFQLPSTQLLSNWNTHLTRESPTSEPDVFEY